MYTLRIKESRPSQQRIACCGRVDAIKQDLVTSVIKSRFGSGWTGCITCVHQELGRATHAAKEEDEGKGVKLELGSKQLIMQADVASAAANILAHSGQTRDEHYAYACVPSTLPISYIYICMYTCMLMHARAWRGSQCQVWSWRPKRRGKYKTTWTTQEPFFGIQRQDSRDDHSMFDEQRLGENGRSTCRTADGGPEITPRNF